MTQTDVRLAMILTDHDKTRCPRCNRLIDRGDIAWNEGHTEAGTPWTWVEIQCQGCDTEIARISSWWPDIKDFEDVVNILDQDWH